MSITRLLTILSVGALAACGDATVAPSTRAMNMKPEFIVNGEPTGNAFASVGALLFDRDGNGQLDGNDELCTGSLIAPDVFLTAAHCVAHPSVPPGTQFYVSFAPDLNAGGIQTIAATSFVYDPAFGHDVAKVHDNALVFLPHGSTAGMTPYKLPRASFLDDAAAKGALSKIMFVNVGYGADATRHGKTTFSDDDVRKSSLSEYMSLTSGYLKLLMNTSATGEGGNCFGDSGGPKFLASDLTTVLATATLGDPNCRTMTSAWRLDTPEARNFLGLYLTLP